MLNNSSVPIIIAIALIIISYAGNAQGIRHIRPQTPIMSPRPMDSASYNAGFYKWNSRDIVKKFRDNGLEAREMNPGYLMEPAFLREATVFLIPSYGEKIGGYVSTYDSETKLMQSKKYYMKMNKDRKKPAWWIFEMDNALLLISGRVPEAVAREYENVLKNMQ